MERIVEKAVVDVAERLIRDYAQRRLSMTPEQIDKFIWEGPEEEVRNTLSAAIEEAFQRRT